MVPGEVLRELKSVLLTDDCVDGEGIKEESWPVRAVVPEGDSMPVLETTPDAPSSISSSPPSRRATEPETRPVSGTIPEKDRQMPAHRERAAPKRKKGAERLISLFMPAKIELL